MAMLVLGMTDRFFTLFALVNGENMTALSFTQPETFTPHLAISGQSVKKIKISVEALYLDLKDLRVNPPHNLKSGLLKLGMMLAIFYFFKN